MNRFIRFIIRVTTYVYDALRRRTGILIESAGGTRSISFVTAYNTLGRFSSTTSSVSTDLNGEGVFYSYDANGNGTELVDIHADSVTHYEYDPFGNILRQIGPAAGDNPFRYSIKYTDDETGWIYYGYRYLNPEMGRWPNRDPIEERGGLNLYAIVSNNLLLWIDMLGLSSWYDACVNGCKDDKKKAIEELQKWHDEQFEKMKEHCNPPILFGYPLFCEQKYYEEKILPEAKKKEDEMEIAYAACLSLCCGLFPASCCLAQ